MENGFSSSRSDVFRTGLRVLVVDDDPTWLKLLEKMLKKCSCEVTTCGLATDALRLLRERKDGFDIVISDVNMPDMDGFKLLEHIGLEMDLPVIMMSADGETSRVMKGVQHGACDYLLKPITMKELKNIWQHVFRKKIHEIRDIESRDCLDGVLLATRNGLDHPDEAHLLGLEDLTCARKRKDSDNNRHDNNKDYGNNDAASAKKARVVWSVDLHQKFVKAVNKIGFEKVGPKKILDLMNVPWLTRENVASHLQKYRLYLSRLQQEKENESRPSFGGIKNSDLPPKEPPGSFRFPTSNSYRNGLEDDLKAIVSEPVVDSQTAAKKSSQIGFDHSFVCPMYNSWTGEASEIQFGQEHKPVLLHLENSFTKLPLPDPIQSPIPSFSSKPSPASENFAAASIDSFPITAKVNHQPLEPIYASMSLNNCAVDFGDDFQFLFQGSYGCDLLGVCNVGFSDCNDDEGLEHDYYDPMRFGFEYPYDPTEYAMIDQSLLT